jgi:hypothetical protein
MQIQMSSADGLASLQEVRAFLLVLGCVDTIDLVVDADILASFSDVQILQDLARSVFQH